MQNKKITTKKLRKLYDKLYKAYYLNSILNKILIGVDNFEESEINALSYLCNSYISSARRQALKMIPVE